MTVLETRMLHCAEIKADMSVNRENRVSCVFKAEVSKVLLATDD